MAAAADTAIAAGVFQERFGRRNGKRASAAAILAVFPDRFHNYYEPFLGSGAVYFALQATYRIRNHAYLSDVNHELITTHRIVRDQPSALIRELSQHAYDRNVFDAWKALDPDALSPLACATRMIYLNRTCFNGLYRTNRAGKFNVPFGRYTNPTICNTQALLAASIALQHTCLYSGDYRGTCITLEPGDHVPPRPAAGDVWYADPPYIPVSPTSNFTSYSAPFGKKAHEALAVHYAALAKEGVAVALSNADVPLARDLYKGFHIRPLQVKRNINSAPGKRGAVGEILVTANCRGD